MSGFRILIDYDLCQGHGVCQSEAPDLFHLVETDSPYLQSAVISAPASPEALTRARAAQRFCPNRAITVIEEN